MKWLADQIRRLGFRPGIWTAPFGTGDEAFYKEHKGWFLHHPDGQPMRNWNGRFAVDPSQPAVRRHVESIHRTMAEGWGYEFFKVDGLSGTGPSYSAHFYERPDVRSAFRSRCDEPLRTCVQAIRRGVGRDRFILSCMGHYTGPEASLTDAARVGTDVVSPGKPPGWRNYLSQVTSTLAQLFVHNIVWYNDPDTLLVGDFASDGTARLAATAVALPGQVTFLGDKLAELPDDRVWLLQRCLPVCDVRPLDLYPIYSAAPVWDLKVRRAFGAWDVVSLFNFNEEGTRTIGVDLADMGLDADGEYLAYDFWRGRMIGSVPGRLEMDLKPRSNALIALHRDLGRPQFVSTDRHLTQGAVSLKELQWSPDTATLSGVTRLVAKETTTMTLYVPSGFSVKGAAAKGAEASATWDEEDRVVRLQLTAAKSRSSVWEVGFETAKVGRGGGAVAAGRSRHR